ncbi:MAG: DUF218 domain-containing protein [Bacteroidales bacterium]|nr:DUF218 domain-containing protein [Bacteroidales bacterium]
MKKFITYLIYSFLAILSVGISLNLYVNFISKPFIYSKIKDLPVCYTALVLGAYVSNSGEPSDFLRDRLDKAAELYHSKKVKKLLLSGDHGTITYDEVNNMRDYLLKKGIDTQDIFLDHAGFDTYNSIVRAHEIFEVNEMIIVSQEFHLPRALYIARNKKLKAFGIIADKTMYHSLSYLKFREQIANVKAFMEVSINKSPKFLGEKIPITGDSFKSYDK